MRLTDDTRILIVRNGPYHGQTGVVKNYGQRGRYYRVELAVDGTPIRGLFCRSEMKVIKEPAVPSQETGGCKECGRAIDREDIANVCSRCAAEYRQAAAEYHAEAKQEDRDIHGN